MTSGIGIVVRWILDKFGLVPRADLEAVQEDLARLADPEMRDLRLADGGINIEVAGLIVERLALSLTAWFREGGTENYVEMNLIARDDSGDAYVVTV